MVYPRSARAGLLGSHYRESAPHPTGLPTFLMKSRGIETGIDIKLAELAWLIGNVIGFEGLSGKPDRASRKLLDVTILGRRSRIDLDLTVALHRPHRNLVTHKSACGISGPRADRAIRTGSTSLTPGLTRSLF